MVSGDQAYVTTYGQLYEHFGKYPNQFYVVQKLQCNEIAVYVKDPSVRDVEKIVQHPVSKGKLRVHYFLGPEVSNPNNKIPIWVIDDVCNHLGLSKDIFTRYEKE